MKFEKLSCNKLKIIMNLRDLQEKNIDFHSFMSNSIESQELFFDMLKEAEKKCGFVTSNYNIHIEAFATLDGTFIFTITRAEPLNIPKPIKLIYKRKLPQITKDNFIYVFNSFDNYCNFCTFLDCKLNGYIGNSDLILYNSKYYLILRNMKMPLSNSKKFFTYISEFANLCSNSNLLSNIILEHGEKLIHENAIEVGMNYLK